MHQLQIFLDLGSRVLVLRWEELEQSSVGWLVLSVSGCCASLMELLDGAGCELCPGGPGSRAPLHH